MTGALTAQRWHLGVGDLTGLGWLTVVCYAIGFGSAIAVVVVARRASHTVATADAGEARKQRVLARVWFVVAVALLLLGVDKLLDLQTWFILTMRRVVCHGGWYERRRELQAQVIAVLLVLGAVLGAALTYCLRRVAHRIALVLAGVLGLVGLAVIQAISFHYVDAVLDGGGRADLAALIELVGIVAVVVGALWWHVDERRIVAETLARRPAWLSVPPVRVSIR